MMRKDVIIVGGGVAGMGCAARLEQLRAAQKWTGSYKLLEKTSGLGGKCTATLTSAHYFDLGVQQFMEPSTRSWKTVTDSLRKMKMISKWGRVVKSYDAATRNMEDLDEEVTRHVMVPSVRVLEKFIFGAGISNFSHIFQNTNVTMIQRWERDQWIVKQEDGKWKRCDVLALACPPQVIIPAFTGSEAFPLPDTPLMDKAGVAKYNPLLVFVIGWNVPGIADFDILRFKHHLAFSAAYNNCTKDARPAEVSALTFVCTPEFSSKVIQLSMTREEILMELGAAFQKLPTAQGAPAPVFGDIHMWPQGYHESTDPLERLYDEEARLGVCGDWTGGSNTIEAAWVSGVRLANQIAGFTREPEKPGQDPSDYMDPVTQTSMNQRLMRPVEARPAKPYFPFEKEE
eukprot:TRINITY_DN13781_c0_g1_i1.p1 TRINITY_DN13781_c0_g1~~TRINITY_DN13781_c0_g1_i1.p1  ORF type:complete len:400 (+),score=75.02 TRINITY_DN13781_c0_g1_i1:55-1254(+)